MSASENQIVVYQPNETVRLDVRLENETVWLPQNQMATLFGSSADNIGLYLKKIYSCEEVDKGATTEESSVVQIEGRRKVSRKACPYNLGAYPCVVTLDVLAKHGYGVKIESILKATSEQREYGKCKKLAGAKGEQGKGGL